MSAETAIHVEGLKRVFRVGQSSVHAVDDVTLSLPRGRLTVVKGRSGSGKTTLLNIVGLLDRPNEGKVSYGTTDVLKMSDHERDRFRRHEIGFVYQTIALVSLMTAYENVDFRLRVAGMGYQTREERVNECLRMVGLE